MVNADTCSVKPSIGITFIVIARISATITVALDLMIVGSYGEV